MQLSLYNILNIPENIIIGQDNNINFFLKKSDLSSLNSAIAIVNKFHSYFHFEQSYAYLIFAYLDSANEDEWLEKAIFQDHLNQRALNFKRELVYLLSYDKAIKLENDFLSFAIGPYVKQKEVDALDIAITKVLSLNAKEALDILNSLEYKSHRFYLARAVAYIDSSSSLAFENIEKSVKMIESAHKSYHELAAIVFRKRAEAFRKNGQEALYKNDMIKAGDLFS